ncbi:MAG: serine hydrolase domain-containing protein [Blastomonas sp.]
MFTVSFRHSLLVLPAILIWPACVPAAVASPNLATEPTAAAQASQDSDARLAAVRGHIRALERSGQKSLDDVVEDFEANRFSVDFFERNSPEDRRELLSRIRDAADQAGGVLVREESAVAIVTLNGPRNFEIRFRLEDGSPYRIQTLELVEATVSQSSLTFTPENLADTFRMLERDQGFSGVVFVQRDGVVIHRGAYGFSNSETGQRNSLGTVFGIGSRPIDFTIAAILLLDQRGKIKLDDTIDKYFEGVPADKSTMTIRHLLNGQSGLPDFHGLPSDGDQDLAWIDRTTAERRILSQPLLFSPGQGDAHSHSAFVLLAALVERASGDDYMAYLKENFFDPAGMTHTGEFGAFNGLSADDFAVGGGPQSVGNPNIPPNWGRISWLVKGSGGMYSNLDDLLRFYRLVRSDQVLDEHHRAYFLGSSVSSDGSMRGFELFSAYDEDGADAVYVFFNMPIGNEVFRPVTRALEAFVEQY